ncbi:histidine kinase [Elizabethkingia miricola]|uniref:histidine kinase n=1 Tax=Elizabethkingia miricola TaxID=172045 RepID=UPI0009991F88|nr:histidine kinase [Elizabethkingia miricola]OPC14466.1 histidine kinase [Elizabethkingia miricola]OPC32724.1 histidine kinase [Elizabethkingia miricola]
MKFKEIFVFSLIGIIVLAGGLYLYSSWKMKQEVQDVTTGSLLFRKVSGFSGSQGRKTYYTAYRVDKIAGDTIFVNPINEVMAVPYSVLEEESYSLLKKEGKKAVITPLTSDRAFFEKNISNKEQAEKMFPELKKSPFYYFKSETEKIMKKDLITEQVIRRWTNEPSVNNNFSNTYYPEGNFQSVDAFIK